MPLFRGIDLALQTLDILPPAIDAMQFRAERIQLDPAIHAAEEANRLVVDGRHSVPRGLPARGGEAETLKARGPGAHDCCSAAGAPVLGTRYH